MRRVGPTILIAAVLWASPLAATGSPEPTLPQWLSGCWQWREGTRWGEECWTIPRAGQMLGSGRTGDGDNVASWEFMRIQLNQHLGEGPIIRMAFAASPSGGDWTWFAWSPDQGEGVSFYNAANDYPQRVRYWREGDLLKAEISQLDGSRAMGWTFARMGG